MKSIVSVLLMVSSLSYAGNKKVDVPVYRAVSYLHWFDSKGKMQKFTLHVEDKKVRVNLYEMPQSNWKKAQASVTKLTAADPKIVSNCPVPLKYSLTVYKKKSSKIENGCTTSARFKEIESEIKKLKDLTPE